MNFRYKITSILLITALFFQSCDIEDRLNTVPLTSFSDLTVFDTPARVQQQINGLYASVKNGNLLGGRFFVYNDVRADYFINETNNNVTGLSVWNHTVQPSNVNDVTNLWNTAYLAINRANVFIAGIDANTQKLRDSGLTDAQLNEFKAEARFLRALVYNSLLTLYASPFADGAGAKPGVPLQLNANVASGDNDLPRSSVAQVYAQILEDLNFAEANLPATRGNALNNSTRAIRSASIALKTRVFLHMQRYADVVTEANKLVSANPPYVAAGGVAHTLAPTVGEVFRTPWTHVERIFSFPFTENDLPGTQNGLGSYYNPGPRGIGDFSLNNSGIIGDTVNWITTDDRRAFIFRNTSNNKNYWNKFASGPQHLDYVPVLRYAEVLLNLAEASARTGNTDRALSLLNTVRTRSKGGEYEPFGTQAELVEAILKEREIELLGEGFRAPDLMRLLRPLPGKSNVGPVPSSSSGYIWPIPAGELIVNKAVVQNPGY